MSVAPGFMTLSEPTLSSANPADVIDGYLGSMGRLAERFLAMPGATAIKIEPYKKPESLLARVVVGVALIIALIGAWRLHGPAASTTPAITSVPAIPARESQTDAAPVAVANT